MTLINPFISFPAAGGGGSFTPTDLATLSAWYDASDAGSFTFGTGTDVAQWNDLGPNGYHVTQATTANQPIRDSTLNGLSVVRFDGGRFLTRTSAPINNSTDGSWTVFVVTVLDSTSGVRSIVDSDNTGVRTGQFIRLNGTTPETIGFYGGGTAVIDSAAAAVTATPYLYRSLNDGTTTLELFVGGSSGGGTAIGGTQDFFATAPLTLGATSNSPTYSQKFVGKVAEVICCSSALSGSDITDTEAYLTSKWGL